MGFLNLFKKENQKVSRQLIRSDAVEVVVNNIISNFSYTLTLSEATIEEMMNDLDIKAASDSRIESITAKQLSLMSRNGKDTSAIEERFNNINFNDVIKNIMKSLEKERTFQELVWGEKFIIEDVKLKASWKYSRDKEGWYYNFGGEKQYLQPYKYLISINEECEEYPFGRSELESLLKIYEIKKTASEKAANIVTKYGEIIKWYMYDKQTFVKSDGTIDQEKLKLSADKFREMTDANVVAVPGEGGDNVGFGKTFGFITLDKFNTQVHLSLIRWCQEQIGKAYFGGSLTQDYGTNGSYSLAQGHQEIRKEKSQSLCNYIQNVLQQLLWIDGQLYGYDDKEYYWKLEDEPDQKQIAETNVIKADKILKLSQAGYKVKTETIEKELGYQAGDIIEVTTNVNSNSNTQ